MESTGGKARNNPLLVKMRDVLKYIPDMSLKEYFETYSPEVPANACCFQCKRAYGGCSWSRSFVLPEGAVAYESTSDADGERTKILYCPLFCKDGTEGKKPEYDLDCCFELLLAIAEDLGNEYRAALRRILECRNPKGTDTAPGGSVILYRMALDRKRNIEEVFDAEKCKRMQEQVGYKDDDFLDRRIMEITSDALRRPKVFREKPDLEEET